MHIKYKIYSIFSLGFITKCCLFSRQDNGGEDKHLRNQFWTSLRHRHGESSFLFFANICFINTGEILSTP